MKKVVLFKNESEEYRKAFSAINYETVFLEPLQFEYVNVAQIAEKLLQNDYDGLILTSPRAIVALAKCWNPSMLVIWNNKRVYTVGEASRRTILTSLRLEALGETSGNAQNLAKMIIEENPVNSKFLFPCGNLSSETLPRSLSEAGIIVDALTVYETKVNSNLKTDLIQLDSRHDPCCLVFFSPSGCEYIHKELQNFSNKLNRLPHFAIGNTTAHKVESLGLEIAGVPDKPQAASLVEIVQNYFNTIKKCS